MAVQPRTPPGVLELIPSEQLAFQRMLDTVRRGFERFGFLPIETPVFELTDVLLTKSGGETEKQVFFVQSTGTLDKERQRIAQHLAQHLAQAAGGAAAGAATELLERPELALRYDLTVPLARWIW